ncbi:MAG TPA: hypothetical protein VJS13_01220 [Pyrinomonadaceae bacterium]|nr:hypothetical protein [Pyrinomonadaceae bacterium]
MSQPMPAAAGTAQTLPEVVGNWTLTVESCVAQLNELNILDIAREESTGSLRGSVADLVGPDQILRRDLHDARFDPAPDLKFTVILDPLHIYTFTGSVNSNTMSGTIDGPSCREGSNHNEEVGTWSATAQPGQVLPER